jgi:hypothetical protein
MSNCLLFALRRWLRRGGYVIPRRSHYGWWPHFLWSPDLKRFWEYTPPKPNQYLLVPPPLFRGVIKEWGMEPIHKRVEAREEGYYWRNADAVLIGPRGSRGYGRAARHLGDLPISGPGGKQGPVFWVQ